VWPVLAVAVLLVAAGAFAGGWFAGSAGLVEPVDDPARGETFTFGAGGDISEFGVSVGSCGATPLQKGRGVPNSVGCDDLHDFEVVYGTELYQSDGFGYPSRERLVALGHAACEIAFNDDAYVKADQRGRLAYMTLLPSRATWNDSESPERSVVCAVRDRDRSQLSASVSPQE
jgi:hypothetical protein